MLALHVAALQRVAFLQVFDFELLGLLDQCEVVFALLGLPGLELRDLAALLLGLLGRQRRVELALDGVEDTLDACAVLFLAVLEGGHFHGLDRGEILRLPGVHVGQVIFQLP